MIAKKALGRRRAVMAKRVIDSAMGGVVEGLEARRMLSGATFSLTQFNINNVTGFQPEAVAVGDLNGDHKPDVVVADSVPGDPADSLVKVLFNDGNGGLVTPEVDLPQADPNATLEQVAIGDVNGDGVNDIVAGYAGGFYSVYTGNGNGTFSVLSSGGHQIFQLAGGVGAMGALSLVDLNGDGKLDLVATDNGSASNPFNNTGRLAVALGNGDGTFQPAMSTSAFSAGAMAMGDFNGDHKVDVAVSSQSSGFVIILTGNGDGTFNQGGQFSIASAGVPVTHANGIVAADLNGDGKTDIAVDSDVENSVKVFFGSGAGTFSAGPAIAIAGGGGQNANPRSLAAGDFNLDGAMDLVVGKAFGGTDVLVNDGHGNFTVALTADTGSSTDSLAVADLNVDGRPDIVGPAAAADKVSVLLNTTPVTATTTLAVTPVTATYGATGLTLTATLGAPLPLANESVQFALNGTPVGTATTDANGVATLTGVSLGSTSAGDYLTGITATFLGDVSKGAGAATASADLIVTPVTSSSAKLAVAYTGSNLAFADGSGHVSIPLRATLQDNSGGQGSITTAQVVFRIVNAQTGAVVGAVSATAPTSVDVPGSPVQLTGTSLTTGDSVATWSTDLGTASSETFSVQVIVNGNYAGQTSGLDLLTLAKQDGSVSGGGWIRASSATAGQFAADAGSKINYSFNVKQNSQGMSGQVMVIFRRTSGGVLHSYEFATSQITSFGDNTSTGQANFSAVGNLMDVTDALHPVLVASNVTLGVAATDGGNGGQTDMLGITLWSGQTLDLSTDWNGLNTVQDLLGGGNINVK
jgi:hypothetical protein